MERDAFEDEGQADNCKSKTTSWLSFKEPVDL